MYERVLIPIDSREVAESVLPYAEELAGHIRSEVTLLYVCESAEEYSQRLHELYLGMIAEGVKRDAREHFPVKRGAGIKVKSVALVGKPDEEIINYASNNDIDLIVIATRPRSHIMYHSMGHTADKLLQVANIPVLLTTTKAHPIPAPRQLLDRILLPLDGSERGEAVVPYVAGLAKKEWAHITLLQVLAPDQHVHTVGGLDHVKLTEQQIESMQERAEQYLENVGQRLADTRSFVRCEVRVGDTVKEIISLAHEMNARLVAISTSRYPRIRELISGSITQKILEATDIPVLLVKAPG